MSPQHFDAWLTAPPTNRRPLVMGILNVTPDSFSDGGQFASVDRAVAHAEAMAAAGADLIDIGGESTRPGSARVPADVQVARVLPVLNALRGRDAFATFPVTLSIDTTRAAVAEAALDAGASVVNDISAGLDDLDMLPHVARRGVPIVLMHMRGTPATMQHDPTYADVTREICEILRGRISAAMAAGVEEHRILLDPGIGFGKTIEHNLTLLQRLGDLLTLGRPLVVGTSRKGFIGKLTGETEASHRLFGTAASVAWSIAHGASIVRVHDVGPMSQVVRMIGAIQRVGR